MSFKTILVPTEQTLETTLQLARKFDSYIEGFALQAAIPAIFAMGDVGSPPIPALEESVENAKRTRSLFENFMQDHDVPCGSQTKGLSCDWLEGAPEGDHLWAATAVSSM